MVRYVYRCECKVFGGTVTDKNKVKYFASFVGQGLRTRVRSKD